MIGGASTHAVLRAKERYGIDLDGGMAQYLLDRCRKKKALFCHTGRNNAGIWADHLGAVPVIFLVDADLRTIISFLPQDHLKSGTMKRLRMHPGKRRPKYGKQPLKARKL